jgi:hypothetical protein
MLFENVTLTMLWPVLLAIGIGLALRTFVPYLRVAYGLIKETNQWKIPRFEPKYVLPPLATAGVYVLAILTTEDALLILSEAHPTVLILTTYLGEDVIRRAVKSLTGS